MHLSNPAGDSATISLYGGQVLSWCTAQGVQHLYCSPQALSAAGHGKPLRGGVPVCFPQFASYGPLAKHGFARTLPWRLLGVPNVDAAAGVARASLMLMDSESTLAVWPFHLQALLHVSLGAGWLDLQLEIVNTGQDAVAFTAALHTYLAVADVRNAALLGLEQVEYWDALDVQKTGAAGHPARLAQTQALLRFASELDRVYLDVPHELKLVEPDETVWGNTQLVITQTGFSDTVVWNPGPAKAAALGDMPALDWTRMLCVEAAQVAQPVALSPGERWLGAQRLTQV